MKDPIKKAYQHLWKTGSEREELVKGLLEAWGFEVEPHGFMALDDSYTPEWSEEKGVPDLVITNRIGQQIFIEVTGTNNIHERAKIWIREHKIDYAMNNPDKEIFVAHVITKTRLIRFVKISNVDFSCIPKEGKNLHTILTNFYIIPHNMEISSEKMKYKLMAWRARMI